MLTAPADCAIELAALTRRPTRDERVCGRFSHVANGITHRYRLLLRPDLPVLTRVTLDEETLVAGAVIEGDRIAAPASSAGGFVERLIGLAIELMMSRYPDDYWRLGELELAYLPPESAAIGCMLTGSVGERLWQCSVLAEDRLIGRLLLALAPRPDEPRGSTERP